LTAIRPAAAALLIGALGASAGGAAPAVTAPYVINVAPGGQPHVPIVMKKTVELDARVALSYDGVLALNTLAADRAGLKSFPLVGKFSFKNALFPGGMATFRINLFDVTPRGLPKRKIPVLWVDKPVAADADGVLPVSLMQADQIVFNLGPQAPNARVYTITRKDRDSVIMRARVGDETIDVTFELNSPDTVMNARAAAAFSNAGLVKRNGEVSFWRPFPGIALPLERMTPAQGAAIVGLPMGRPAVRITEAQAKELDARTKAGTSTAEDDGDAITVTASRKKGNDPRILIGRDVLGACSRIVFDRPGKSWQLTCAF